MRFIYLFIHLFPFFLIFSVALFRSVSIRPPRETEIECNPQQHLSLLSVSLFFLFFIN